MAKKTGAEMRADAARRLAASEPVSMSDDDFFRAATTARAQAAGYDTSSAADVALYNAAQQRAAQEIIPSYIRQPTEQQVDQYLINSTTPYVNPITYLTHRESKAAEDRRIAHLDTQATQARVDELQKISKDAYKRYIDLSSGAARIEQDPVTGVNRVPAGAQGAKARWQQANAELAQLQRDLEAKKYYDLRTQGMASDEWSMPALEGVGGDYAYINGDRDTQRMLAMAANAMSPIQFALPWINPDPEQTPESISDYLVNNLPANYYISDDERQLYNYIYRTQGDKAASEYLQYLQSDLDARRVTERNALMGAYAEQYPALALPASVLNTPLKAAGAVYGLVNLGAGQPIDPNSQWFDPARDQTVIRDVGTQDMSDVGRFLTQTGLSIGDFMFTQLVTGGFGAGGASEAASLAIMGTGAASDTMREVKERGGSDEQAVGLAVLAGAAEVLFEKISLDRLIGMTSPTSRASIIKNALLQGGIEASEEAATEIANIISDVLVMGDLSEYKDKSPEEIALQVALSALGGFLSGAPMGGFATAGSRLGARSTGADIRSSGNTQALTDTILNRPDLQGTDLYKLAQEIAANPSVARDYDLGRLYYDYITETGLEGRDGAALADIARTRQTIDQAQTREEVNAAYDQILGSMDDQQQEQAPAASEISDDLPIAHPTSDQAQTVEAAEDINPDTYQRSEAEMELDREIEAERALAQAAMDAAGARAEAPTVQQTQAQGIAQTATPSVQAQAQQQTDIPEDAHAAKLSTGEAVAVMPRITDIDSSGDAFVELSDGRTVNIKDIQMDDKDVSDAYNLAAAAFLGDVEAANAFLGAYISTADAGRMELPDFFDAYAAIYNAARDGASQAAAMSAGVQSANMPNMARQIAYAAGLNARMQDETRAAAVQAEETQPKQEAAEAKEQPQKAPAKKPASKKAKAGVVREYTSKISDEREAAIKVMDIMARALRKGKGVIVHIVDNINTGDDGVTGVNVRDKGRLIEGNKNAFYDPKTGEYYIALDAVDESLLFIITHESIHDIAANNPSGYAKLEQIVLDELAKQGQDVDALIKYHQDQGLSEAKARQEVVCNTVPVILTDSKTADVLMDRVLHADDATKTAFRTILDSIADFLARAYMLLRRHGGWTHLDSLKGDMDAIDRIRNAYIDALEGLDTQEQAFAWEDASFSGKNPYYDYSKPFAEQIDDYKAGKIRKGDTLLVGGTPQIFKDIGFNALPVTINTEHIDYALNGTKDADHFLGEAKLKQLPESLKKPIAVFVSETQPNTSVVALLPFVTNGNQTIAPVVIDGFGQQNGIRINSNAVTSVFGKTNSVTKLLFDAIINEMNGDFSLFYINKKEADALITRARLQLPGRHNYDGYINNIRDSRSPVKLKFENVTETTQFKRWFKKSKAVNKDGTPKLLYHNTNNEFTVFDTSRSGSNQGARLGDGIYLSSSPTEFAGSSYGSRQMQLYASIQKPYEVSRGLSKQKADMIVEKYGPIKHGDIHKYNDLYKNHAVAKLMTPLRTMDYIKEYADDAGIKTSDIFKELGYDGIHDGVEWVAFDSSQVKSATDNIGTYDRNNDDINFSSKDSLDEADAAALREEGIDIDPNSGAAVYDFSYKTAPKTEKEIDDAVAMLVQAGFDEEQSRKWLQSMQTVTAAIYANMGILDYEADPRFSWLKKNSDYPQGSVDFNNNCPKRVEFTALFDRLQEDYPNTVFTAEDFETIRQIMIKNGVTVTCGPCFVEDRRQHLGEIAESFRMQIKDGTLADTFKAKLKGDTYIPTQYDLITYQGFRDLYENHRGVHDAFRAFNNARGQASARLIEGMAEYSNQIQKYGKRTVTSKNRRGGLRIFSLSDADPRIMIDVIQIITDAAEKGLMMQGYTKQAWFAKMIQDTGVKMLRSHIPLGIGYTEDADGTKHLAFDNVEGINMRDPYYFDSTDSANIGNNVIGINNDQIRAAMLDAMIDQIIPFHSGLKQAIRFQKKIGNWVNYRDSQTDKNLSDGKVGKQVNIYTDVINEFEKRGTPIRNKVDFVKAFLQICKERGLEPRFSQFLDKDANGEYIYTEGYHKFLVDYKLFDKNGNIIVQQAVRPVFDDEFNTKILRDYVKNSGVKVNREDVYAQIKAAFTGEADAAADGKLFSSKVSLTDDEDIERLKAENESLQEALDLAKEQVKLTKGHRVSQQDIEKLARDILNEYSSTYDRKKLVKDLKTMFDYMANVKDIEAEIAKGTTAWDEIQRYGMSVARSVLEAGEAEDTTVYDDAAPVRDYLRSTTIRLTSTQAQEAAAAFDSVLNLRRMLFGKANISTSTGTYLDSVWQELSSINPGLFDPDANEGEMVTRLYDVAQMVYDKPVYNPHEINGDMNTQAMDLFIDLFDRYMNLPESMTYADKQAKKFAEQKKQYQEAVKAMRAQLRADYDARLKQLRQENIRKRQELSVKYKEALATNHAEDAAKYKARYRRLTDQANERLMKQKAAFQEWKRKDRMNRVEREAINKYRPLVKKNVNDLYDWLMNPADTDDVPAVLKAAVVQFLNTIEFSRHTDAWKARMAALSEEFQNANADGYDFSADIGLDMSKRLDAFLDMTKDVGSISDMNSAQLKELDEIVQSLKSAARRATRHVARIEKNVKTLHDWLMHPTDAKHVPEALRRTVLQFLGTITFSDSNSEWKARMSELAAALQKMNGDNEYADFYADLDPDLIPRLEAFIDVNRNVSKIAQMDSQQLRELDFLVQIVKHTVQDANRLLSNSRYKAISELGDTSIAQLNQKRDRKRMNAVATGLSDFLNIKNLDSFAFFERLGPAAETVLHALRKGFDTKVRSIKQAYDFMEQLRNGVDMSKLSGRSAQAQTFQVIGGELTLTKANIMELYEANKREQARGHIYGEGIRQPRRAVKIGKKVVQVGNVEPVKVSADDVNRIIATLTPEEKRIADAMQKFLATTVSEWGNEASMTMYGYKKFTEENYWPITVDRNYVRTYDSQQKNGGDLYALKNSGFTKSTIQGANNPYVLGDIFDTFSQHVDEMASYGAFMVPLSDAMKWYNYRAKGVGTVKGSIERVVGKGGKEYFENFIRGLNRVQDTYTLDFMDRLTRGAKTAAVGFNPRVVLQQPTAYVRAASMIHPKYLAQALVSRNGRSLRQTFKLAEEYSPIAQWKDWGYFDMSIGRSMQELIVGNQTPLQKLRGYSMIPAGFADNITWAALWNACELEIRDKRPDLKPNTEEFYQAVGDRLSDVIDRTQVVDTIFHRSELMRSGNQLINLYTAFMAEPTKSYNMIRSALAAFINDRNAETGTRLARTLVTFFATALATSGAAAIADAFRDDDEEKSLFRKWFDALWKNYAEDANPLNLLPVVKDVIPMLQGFSSSRLDMQGIERAVNVATAWIKMLSGESKWSTYKLIYQTVQAASSFTGIPVSNLMRTFTSMYNTFSPENISMGYSTAENERMRNKLTDAVIANDAQEIERTYSYLVKNSGAADPEESVFSTMKTRFKEAFTAAIDADDVGSALSILSVLRDRFGSYFDEDDATAWLKEAYTNAVIREEAEKQSELEAALKGTVKDAELRAWREKAEKKRQTARFVEQYPYADDLSDEAIDKYYRIAAPAKVPADIFYDAYKAVQDMHSDTEESRQKKVFRYINGLKLSARQKDAMCYVFGYAQSTVQKNAPWR